ncbi:hypothetical protein M2427_001019 [Bradyrhizobium sp. BR13661]|jgi:hypothetical protein|nr:hypothetical protein [Bradyrhizobium sp. BR13661]
MARITRAIFVLPLDLGMIEDMIEHMGRPPR